MPRSLTRFLLFLLLVVLVVVFIATFSSNVALVLSRSSITRSAEKFFTQKLSIGGVWYVPPHFIILRNVTVSEPKAPERAFVRIDSIVLRLSLSESLRRKEPLITDIVFYRPRMGYAEFVDFLKNNYEQILAFIRNLPQQDVRFAIRRFRLDRSDERIKDAYVVWDAALNVKGQAFTGSGCLVTEKSPRDVGVALRYKIKGSLGQNTVTWDNLELARENFYVKLWGSSGEKSARLKGFIFANTRFREYFSRPSRLSLFEKAVAFVRRPAAELESVDLPQANLFILDIDSDIAFSYPYARIEKLACSINNTPVSASGTVTFGKMLACDARVSLFPSHLRETRIENLKRIDAQLNATFEDSILNLSGQCSAQFSAKKTSTLPLERIDLEVHDLTVFLKDYPHCKAHVNNGTIFCRTDSNTYVMPLSDLTARLDLSRDRLKYAAFSSRLYDGFVRGRAMLDLSQPNPRIATVLRIRDVSADKLESLVVHFAKVHGTLSAQMKFVNSPELFLRGGFLVRNGSIENFEFFKWLADFFNLPSLRTLKISRAAAFFSVDQNGAGFKGLRMVSPEVRTEGFFHLGSRDMVSSKIGLVASRDLLAGSRKFAPLLFLVKKELQELPFDFQLSGNLHRMNFQWLQSDFKRKIQNAVPGFIGRKIERDIERAIATISDQP